MGFVDFDERGVADMGHVVVGDRVGVAVEQAQDQINTVFVLRQRPVRKVKAVTALLVVVNYFALALYDGGFRLAFRSRRRRRDEGVDVILLVVVIETQVSFRFGVGDRIAGN